MMQGVLMTKLADRSVPQILPDTDNMMARGFLNFHANSESPEIPTYVTIEEA